MHAESPCKSVSFFVTKVWYKYSIPDFLQKSKPIFLVRDIKTANAALAQSNPQRSAHRCRPCHNRIPTRQVGCIQNNDFRLQRSLNHPYGSGFREEILFAQVKVGDCEPLSESRIVVVQAKEQARHEALLLLQSIPNVRICVTLTIQTLPVLSTEEKHPPFAIHIGTIGSSHLRSPHGENIVAEIAVADNQLACHI